MKCLFTITFFFLILMIGEINAIEGRPDISGRFTVEWGEGPLYIFGREVSVDDEVGASLTIKGFDPPILTRDFPGYCSFSLGNRYGYGIRREVIEPGMIYRILIQGAHRGHEPGIKGWIKVGPQWKITEVKEARIEDSDYDNWEGEGGIDIDREAGIVRFGSKSSCDCECYDGGPTDLVFIVQKAYEIKNNSIHILEGDFLREGIEVPLDDICRYIEGNDCCQNVLGLCPFPTVFAEDAVELNAFIKNDKGEIIASDLSERTIKSLSPSWNPIMRTGERFSLYLESKTESKGEVKEYIPLGMERSYLKIMGILLVTALVVLGLLKLFVSPGNDGTE